MYFHTRHPLHKKRFFSVSEGTKIGFHLFRYGIVCAIPIPYMDIASQAPDYRLRQYIYVLTNHLRFFNEQTVMESKRPSLSIPEFITSFECELEKWQPSRSVTGEESAASSIRNEGVDFEKKGPVLPKPDVGSEAPTTCPPPSIESGRFTPKEQEQVIPPAVGGPGAWLFLAGCFGIEMLVWGKL